MFLFKSATVVLYDCAIPLRVSPFLTLWYVAVWLEAVDLEPALEEDFEVPVEKVRKWNRLKGNTVAVGRTLLIYKPLPEASGPQVASVGEAPPPLDRAHQGIRDQARGHGAAGMAAHPVGHHRQHRSVRQRPERPTVLLVGARTLMLVTFALPAGGHG